MFKNLLTVKIAFLFLFVFAVAIGESAEWTWNGYFGTNYEDSTVSGSYGSFDTFVLSTISTINIDENMRLIGQIDWEHAGYFDISLSSDGSKTLNKRSSGEIALSKAYAEYSIIESLNVRAGKFFAPIGFQNQLFYALPVSPYLKIPRESVYKKYSTTADPMSDAIFYQRYAQGLWIGGNYDSDVLNFAYDVFYTNGKTFIDYVDDNNHKAVGGRIMLTPVLLFKATPIVSFYMDEFNSGTPATPVWKSQITIIPGIELGMEDLVVKTEFAISGTKNIDGSKDVDFSAGYVDAYYTVGKITPYVRYELYDPNVDNSDDKEAEGTIGIAYHIIPWMSQIKIQVRRHDYQNDAKEDYNVWGAGVAIGF